VKYDYALQVALWLSWSKILPILIQFIQLTLSSTQRVQNAFCGLGEAMCLSEILSSVHVPSAHFIILQRLVTPANTPRDDDHLVLPTQLVPGGSDLKCTYKADRCSLVHPVAQ
jgi:hypothetical protein